MAGGSMIRRLDRSACKVPPVPSRMDLLIKNLEITIAVYDQPPEVKMAIGGLGVMLFPNPSSH